MNVKVFQTNANGRIEFTRCELEKLLNEIYKEGYTKGEEDAMQKSYVWSPTLTTNLPIVYDTVTTDTGVKTNGITSTAKLTAKDRSADIIDMSGTADMNVIANAVENILTEVLNPKTYASAAAASIPAKKEDVYFNLAKELYNL